RYRNRGYDESLSAKYLVEKAELAELCDDDFVWERRPLIRTPGRQRMRVRDNFRHDVCVPNETFSRVTQEDAMKWVRPTLISALTSVVVGAVAGLGATPAYG